MLHDGRSVCRNTETTFVCQSACRACPEGYSSIWLHFTQGHMPVRDAQSLKTFWLEFCSHESIQDRSNHWQHPPLLEQGATKYHDMKDFLSHIVVPLLSFIVMINLKISFSLAPHVKATALMCDLHMLVVGELLE